MDLLFILHICPGMDKVTTSSSIFSFTELQNYVFWKKERERERELSGASSSGTIHRGYKFQDLSTRSKLHYIHGSNQGKVINNKFSVLLGFVDTFLFNYRK